ncbi:SGNH hydrolase-type esterase domain-containing protein [Dichotomocladium elegans]|nr:SGNH hydrolase-type esterase domain-containing protein [Dichotomocladium elegans]
MVQHIFSSVASYQVLQRDFGTDTAIVKSGDSSVPTTLPIGGPYTVGNATDVYVGDVWVMAGQSNMRGNGFYLDPWTSPVTDYVDTVAAHIHLFNSNESWTVLGSEPTHRLAESIRQVDHVLPDPSVSIADYTAFRGYSLGSSFAVTYSKKMKRIPMGLIVSSHGGTTLDQWSPQLLDATPDASNATLFGAMLARIAKQENQVAGVLWYQGESDADQYALAINYAAKFKSFIIETRARLGNDRLPFIYVQLGRVLGPVTGDEGITAVREAQRKINDGWDSARIRAVAAVDLDLDDYTHLSAQAQKIVGKRLAMAAVHSLDSRAGTSSPMFASLTFEEINLSPTNHTAGRQSSLLIHFKYFGQKDGWASVDRVFGFSLRDSTGNDILGIYSARIQQDGKGVRLFLTREALDRGLKNFFLYYGYGKDPICNLVTKAGMALLAFGPVPIDKTQ